MINYNIKYDPRNLITELYHKDPASVSRPNTYATRYYYDESGNRVRKFTYINSQISPPPITDWNNPGNGWTLLNNEFYVKGVDGKDLAIYQGNILDEWFVWGNDLVGKIKNDNAYYYYKDHLGSVRVVVNDIGAIVAGYDYDAWGYPLENRTFNSDSIKYKYTGKELDKESFYDYFGARYYDARIANWTSIDPLMGKHYDFSPFNYVLRNPLKLIDPDGRQTLPLSQKPYEMEPGGNSLPLGSIGSMIATAALIQSIFDRNESGELIFSIPVEEIAIHALTKNKTGKLTGLETQIENIEIHLKKINEKSPDDPDPHNNEKLWKAHIVKAIHEAYKDFKQAFRKVKEKDFSKYLEQTLGKERMKKIYEGLKQQNLEIKDFIK